VLNKYETGSCCTESALLLAISTFLLSGTVPTCSSQSSKICYLCVTFLTAEQNDTRSREPKPMPSIKFTAAKIKSLEAVRGKQVDYFDKSLRGFFLRVSQEGKKSFGVMYRHGGRLRRMKLGTSPLLSLAKARNKAASALRNVELGEDPATEKQEDRHAATFEQVALEYLERHARTKKKSWQEDERVIKKDLIPEFGKQHAKAIVRGDVRAFLERKSATAPIMANRIRALLRKIFNWAITSEIVESNPVYLVPAPGKERQRDRVLTEDEIKCIWDAIDADRQNADDSHLKVKALSAGIMKLRLLTAQRGAEIMSMEWSELESKTGWRTIPGDKTKNGFSHRVPLTEPALAIITEMKSVVGDDDCSRFVFPSPKGDTHISNPQKALERIQRATKIDFVGHDFRRTAASMMTGMGIPRLTVKKILNHVEREITAVYDRHSYDAEKREALEAWAARLLRVVSNKQALKAQAQK
jgi:integrase